MADITIKAEDGVSFTGYLASPKSGTGAGILVIQEIFGVNKVMRDLCDVYYGVAIEADLGEAGKIAKPLMLHIAEKDSFVPPPAQAQIKTALVANGYVTIHTYPGMEHAFSRAGGEHYDKTNADQANARTAAYFKQHLM